MTEITDDILRLRRAADAEVDRRWTRRNRALAVLTIVALVAVPLAFIQVIKAPWFGVARSYVIYKVGALAADERSSVELVPEITIKVRDWAIVPTREEETLVVVIEVVAPVSPAPTYRVLARWPEIPAYILTTETASEIEGTTWHQAESLTGVIESDTDSTLIAALGQTCTDFSNAVGAPATYCRVQVAFPLGVVGGSTAETASIPDSILVVDGAGVPIADLVLGRDSLRADICQVITCGSIPLI